MRNGPRANGRTFGPQRLLDSRDPVRWTGLGKRLSLRPEECVKHPSKPKRSTITVDRKVRQVMGARLAVSCLGKPPPSALRVHRPNASSADRYGAVSPIFGPILEEVCVEPGNLPSTCGDRSDLADRLRAGGWSNLCLLRGPRRGTIMASKFPLQWEIASSQLVELGPHLESWSVRKRGKAVSR